jgi:GNAT superfamily N-acetyltransferase
MDLKKRNISIFLSKYKGENMITYQIDKEEEYLDDILYHLRKHNHQYTGGKTTDPLYIYLVEGDELIAGAEAGCSWDWASFNKLHYTNKNQLKTLVNKVQEFYREITGIKLVTKVKSLHDDFVIIGFTDCSQVSMQNRTWYYANLYGGLENETTEYKVIVKTESVEIYQNQLEEKHQAFNQKHQVAESKEEIIYIALDGDVFVGGIKMVVYEHSLYTHLLAVNKEYRGKNIGKKLMNFAEQEANKRDIQLLDVGTAEFQARPFYEKLGYKVIYTRKDNPKGYECYTLYKNLESDN